MGKRRGRAGSRSPPVIPESPPLQAHFRPDMPPYARMLADRMLLEEEEPFDTLMERCAAIESRANAPGSLDR